MNFANINKERMAYGLKDYLRGVGDNRVLQNLVDYGGAGLVGAGAQQLTNMVTGGADPNPLISGALAAPALVGIGRYGRFASAPVGSDMAARNYDLYSGQVSNPISQAALTGSAASMLGGGATSLYNNMTSGADVDPNYAATALSLLGGIAPLTMRIMESRGA